jgi:hypothetical protein
LLFCDRPDLKLKLMSITLVPHSLSQVVRPLLTMLKPGGLLILTLKLPGTGRNRGPLVDGVKALLVRLGGAFCGRRLYD